MIKKKRSTKSRLDNKTLRAGVELGHIAMAMAWRGEFDKIWAKAPKIDGRSQKEIFFENVSEWLPRLEREAMSRRLHVKLR